MMVTPGAGTVARIKKMLSKHGPGKTAALLGLSRLSIMTVAVGCLEVRQTTLSQIESNKNFKRESSDRESNKREAADG